jgi:hypothetical protein
MGLTPAEGRTERDQRGDEEREDEFHDASKDRAEVCEAIRSDCGESNGHLVTMMGSADQGLLEHMGLFIT